MRKLGMILAGALLGLGLLPAPEATARSCAATITRTDETYARFRLAVADARSGDTIQVAGVCYGKASMRGERDAILRLEVLGVGTADHPTATLDARAASRVLQIRHANVTIRDLMITNGEANYAGGIKIEQARVVIAGASRVSGNVATLRGPGGGINVGRGGVLVLRNRASVTGNRALEGGGIRVVYPGARLIIGGSVRVSENRAYVGGGILAGRDTVVTIGGDAVITGNRARSRGGGIYVGLTDITLTDSAAVIDNVATEKGGGIFRVYGPRHAVYVCSASVAISPNDPDDPPEVRTRCT